MPSCLFFCYFCRMKKILLIIVIALSMSDICVKAQSQENVKEAAAAISVGTLPSTLNGTSSLFFWRGKLWTCVDHGSVRLYALDTLTASIDTQQADSRTISDMEEVAQDDEYLYLGDFGNNHSALRNNLRVYRLSKSQLLEKRFRYDTIRFTYDGYDPAASNNWTGTPITDYDCEAFVVAGDSLYLFTKQWTGQQTVCYAMPKTPGRHVAEPIKRFNTQGMVTGASYLPEKRLLVLVGYNSVCQPFAQLLYDFEGTDFFGGRHQRVSLGLGMGYQVESIATLDGEQYYMTNERFDRMGVTRDPQLWKMDFSDYLHSYLYPDTTQTDTTQTMELPQIAAVGLTVAPNPSDRLLEVRVELPDGQNGGVLLLYDSVGREVLRLKNVSSYQIIDIQGYDPGMYTLLIVCADGRKASRQVVIR